MKQEKNVPKTAVNQPKQPAKITPVKKSNSQAFVLFEKENYKWMLIGLALILIGFFLLSGGKSEDPKVFHDIKNDFRRWTLAPIVIIAGFALEIWAIMKKPKD